jgi:hypothetical protein
MIKTIGYALLFLNLICSAQAKSGGDVSGGGGISESNILYTFSNLGSYLTDLKNLGNTTLSVNEELYISKLLKASVVEKETKLIFKTQKKFDFKGKQFFKTNISKSKIYINLDNIFILDNKVKRPFNLMESIAFSIKLVDREIKTLLSLKEKEVFFSKINAVLDYDVALQSLMALGRPEVQISSYSYDSKLIGSKILLMDSDELFDFSGTFNKSLICMDPKAKKHITKFNNISYSIDTFNQEAKIQNIGFIGTVQYICEGEHEAVEYFGNAKINLEYGLKTKDSSVLINSNWLDIKKVEAYLIKDKTTIIFSDLVSF